jgi:hypothetical protein
LVPIPIDRSAARALRARFDEAIELVRNEFEGLDAHRRYRNAFARLLKADPLNRVRMTDQRDLFVPELARAIAEHVPRDGHILDLGAGDGQTFALVAKAVPAGTRVSIEEPSPGYPGRLHGVSPYAATPATGRGRGRALRRARCRGGAARDAPPGGRERRSLPGPSHALLRRRPRRRGCCGWRAS